MTSLIAGNAPKSNKDICGALNADGIVVFKECWGRLPGFICKSCKYLLYIYFPASCTTFMKRSK